MCVQFQYLYVAVNVAMLQYMLHQASFLPGMSHVGTKNDRGGQNPSLVVANTVEKKIGQANDAPRYQLLVPYERI